MTIIDNEFVDVATPTGPMRTHVFRPAAEGRYPAIVFYSEIFQITGPIRRTAAMLAGQGFIVAAPEVYHEYEPLGTVLAYDSAGADRGNWIKQDKPVSAFDSDCDATIEFLKNHPRGTGKVGALGICLGGHLSFRAAMHPDVAASVCFYATDIHKLSDHPRGLGPGMADDSLARAARGDIKGELLMLFGRQDPHVPFEGRVQIREALEKSGTNYQMCEFNGAHAFMRDEGPRYNPALAQLCYPIVFEVFRRVLG